MSLLGLTWKGWLGFGVLVVATLPNAPANIGGTLGVVVTAYLIAYAVTIALRNDDAPDDENATA